MITTTTPSVEGYRVTGYYGVVFGEVITGVNFLKDFGAGIRDIIGGRSAGYENELMGARTEAHGDRERNRRHARGSVALSSSRLISLRPFARETDVQGADRVRRRPAPHMHARV